MRLVATAIDRLFTLALFASFAVASTVGLVSMPQMRALGFDPIWFGVLVVSVAEVGLITPPIGMNLFVLQGVVPGLGARAVMRGVPPFPADIIRPALLVAFAALALWLPGLGQ